MDDGVVIKAEHVSKKYCKSMKRSMLYGVQDIGRNLIGLGSFPDRLRASEFWAVNDVSFELKKGEALGLIGVNGSGKSTLLKMINGIFWPDKGKITVSGRVGPLIEVGAGFHPLLSGRENVYVNGAILGMTKEEVNAKFDEIVEFADIGDFIDAPVKSYSSGMFVRLGFAIAIHSDVDILLIDEVLAVGDTNFQDKCFRRLKEIRDSGTTVVFVSHYLDFVSRLCEKTIVMNNGNCAYYGNSDRAIEEYYALLAEDQRRKVDMRRHDEQNLINIANVELLNSQNLKRDSFHFGESFKIRVEYDAKEPVYDPCFFICVYGSDGNRYIGIQSTKEGFYIEKIQGRGFLEVVFDSILLKAGFYYINVTIYDKHIISPYVRLFNACSLTVKYDRKSGVGLFYMPHRWTLNNKSLDKRRSLE